MEIWRNGNMEKWECGEMENSLQGRWLDLAFYLYTLAQIVQTSCNSNNFSKLVKNVTRAQYNYVNNNTDLSCIDCIYTNCKYKCSPPTVIVIII